MYLNPVAKSQARHPVELATQKSACMSQGADYAGAVILLANARLLSLRLTLG